MLCQHIFDVNSWHFCLLLFFRTLFPWICLSLTDLSNFTPFQNVELSTNWDSIFWINSRRKDNTLTILENAKNDLFGRSPLQISSQVFFEKLKKSRKNNVFVLRHPRGSDDFPVSRICIRQMSDRMYMWSSITCMSHSEIRVISLIPFTSISESDNRWHLLS